MAIAQGGKKTVALKIQTGLGAQASGAGGQIIRRESSINKLTIDSFDNNEINSHQQSTGKTHGLRKVDFSLSGVLSPGTYSKMISSVMRKAFVVTTSLTAKSIIFGGTKGAYTLTSTGLLVLGGFKIGDVIKVTEGTLLATDILNKNLLITSIIDTTITVRTLNGSSMTVGGVAIAACTIALAGKKCIVPLTGHTRDYWTVEDWQSDLLLSEVFKDVVLGKVDIGLPATGNATIQISGAGTDRTKGIVQVLASPTAETVTLPLSGVNGILLVDGTVVSNVTSINLSIDGKVASMGAVIGSTVSPDIQRGAISVDGTFTALWEGVSLQTAFEGNNSVNLIAVKLL